MIAASIFVVSMGTFLQFFIAYCHAVLVSTSAIEISGRVREMAGYANEPLAQVDVERVLELARLCPELRETPAPVRTVNVYYGLLRFAAPLVRPTVPLAPGWIEQERKGCAYFAAVMLDRRITANRALLTEEMSTAI